MMTPVLLGLLGGAGAWLIFAGLMGRRRSLADASAALTVENWPSDLDPVSSTTSRLTALAVRVARIRPGSSLAHDLAVLERSTAEHALDKVQTAVFLAALAPATWLLAAVAGVTFPPLSVAVCTAAGAAGGWLLSDSQVRAKAKTRRAEFDSNLVTYVQLVSILLAGGAGIHEALRVATDYGTGWTFTLIRRSLTESRTRGISPWEGFLVTAERLNLPELADLAASMQLAGESGAQVREALLAKAESLRMHELTAIEADAASNTERMGAPIALLLAGFVVLIGYPGFARILAI